MPAWSLPDPRQLSPEQVAGIGVPRWLNPLPDMDVFKGIWRCWPVAVVLLLAGSASTALPSLLDVERGCIYRGFRGHVALHPDMEFRARSSPLRPPLPLPFGPARCTVPPVTDTLYREAPHRPQPVLPTSAIRCRIELIQRLFPGHLCSTWEEGIRRQKNGS